MCFAGGRHRDDGLLRYVAGSSHFLDKTIIGELGKTDLLPKPDARAATARLRPSPAGSLPVALTSSSASRSLDAIPHKADAQTPQFNVHAPHRYRPPGHQGYRPGSTGNNVVLPRLSGELDANAINARRPLLPAD